MRLQYYISIHGTWSPKHLKTRLFSTNTWNQDFGGTEKDFPPEAAKLQDVSLRPTNEASFSSQERKAVSAERQDSIDRRKQRELRLERETARASGQQEQRPAKRRKGSEALGSCPTSGALISSTYL